MSTILTGIRSNNSLHLGIYIGAIKPMIDIGKNLKSDDKLNLFLPDLHSFTTPIDHSKLYNQTIDNLKVFMALGLDATNPNILAYRQSHVPAHSELAWILDCFTWFGEASRMIQFKEKSQQLGHKQVSVGLMNYPILMAADILLYGAEYVPLGDDQKQHLELARDLAIRLNNQFGELFVVPRAWDEQLKFMHRISGPRIKSLTDPSKKMSKSVDDTKGKIELLDDPASAVKKIMSAETDSLGEVNYDPQNQPGISNLLEIESYLTNQNIDVIAKQWAGEAQYGKLKHKVAQTVESFLGTFQESYANIDESEVMAMLERSEKEANIIANQTLHKVQQAVGLRR